VILREDHFGSIAGCFRATSRYSSRLDWRVFMLGVGLTLTSVKLHHGAIGFWSRPPNRVNQSLCARIPRWTVPLVSWCLFFCYIRSIWFRNLWEKKEFPLFQIPDFVAYAIRLSCQETIIVYIDFSVPSVPHWCSPHFASDRGILPSSLRNRIFFCEHRVWQSLNWPVLPIVWFGVNIIVRFRTF
jgi:hypothetical protein